MLATRNDLKNVLKNYHEKIKELLNNKIDKENGKGLSTNDYTTSEKTKLAGIAADANNYTHPTTHPVSMISGLNKVATSGSYNDLLNKPSTFPPSSHTHDDRYYTETEINSKLDGKANTSHTHDDKLSKLIEMPQNQSLNQNLEFGNYHFFDAIDGYPSGYTSGDNDFILQIVSSGVTNTSWQTQLLTDIRSGKVFKRAKLSGSYGNWQSIDDGGNADTVDGKHASDFLSTSGGTVNGDITFGGIRRLKWSCGRANQSEIFWNASSTADYGVVHKVDGKEVMVVKTDGVTVNTPLNFANNTWNKFGDDVKIGDCNAAGLLGIMGINGNSGLYFAPTSGNVAQRLYTNNANTMTLTGSFYVENEVNANKLCLRDYGTPFECSQYIDFHEVGSNVDYNARLHSAGGILNASSGIQAGNSTGNLKRTTISTASPSGGANGDVWIKYS